MQHVRNTLRAALNLAVREGLIESNPTRHIEIRGYQRPYAKIWTEGRVEQWEQTGERPAVALWTARHLSTFLDSVVDDPLFALWWLAGLRGLRRGELCGLRWEAVGLDQQVLFVERNRTTAGYRIVEGDPKTAAGQRPVALDRHTVKVLRQHRQHQRDQRARRIAAGKPWFDSGYVFTRPDGLPINPNYATTRFRKLADRSGLPPVRLHDLRHGAASLAHEAGADLKTLQDLLGHSSILVTADTYTSVLPATQQHCADATAKLVLAAARRTRKKIKNKARRNRPPNKTGAPAAAGSQDITERQLRGQNSPAPSPTVAAPERHPRDTHRPKGSVKVKGPTRVSAGQASYDLVRPKGLEPLTF
ncbi:tyrosine-type recombinase/integrase [Actinoplanes sp. NEAU-A12]|uniref:Tyrosine-type recombinase/integrase n=2 Tax=Actinoplanes sandaracinus TaxID=3045177 RepID=A0ABT6WHL0_9ACTN|nr:tyrosine-type recombinase/integrase [Actinoplanes sandaracinus]